MSNAIDARNPAQGQTGGRRAFLRAERKDGISGCVRAFLLKQLKNPE